MNNGNFFKQMLKVWKISLAEGATLLVVFANATFLLSYAVFI